MSEMIDIKTMTREEAVGRAAQFCKEQEKPGVLPVTNRLCFGLAGLNLFLSSDQRAREVLYFPIITQPNVNDKVPVSSSVLTDRIAFLGFFDYYYDGLFVDVNKNDRCCYLVSVNKEKNSIMCGSVPFALYEQFPCVDKLAQSLFKNNDDFFRPVMKEVSEQVFKKATSAQELPKTEIPKKEPTSFKFMDIDKISHIELRDRLEIVGFCDRNSEDGVTVVDVPELNSYALAVLPNNLCALVHKSVARASESLSRLLSLDNVQWAAKKNDILKEKDASS